jgi:hypothetical protein
MQGSERDSPNNAVRCFVLAKLLKRRGEASPVFSMFVVVDAMQWSQRRRDVNDACSQNQTGGTTTTFLYQPCSNIHMLACAPGWRIQ